MSVLYDGINSSDEEAQQLDSPTERFSSSVRWLRSVVALLGFVAVFVAGYGLRVRPETHSLAAATLGQGLIEEFDPMETYQSIFQCNPFIFHCPLPLFKQSALAGQSAVQAQESCCHDYDVLSVQWPFQFPECGTHRCETCWLESNEKELPSHRAASLGAVSWAAALAVTGRRHVEPKGLTGRRLQTANATQFGSDPTRHAGLPSKQIIAPVKYGMRNHYANVCPRINDWAEYYLNFDNENIHARVYRSESTKLAVIAFRGTQPGSVKNWEVDADIHMKHIYLGPSGPGRPDGPSSSNVHEGFFEALEKVLPHVRKWVEGYVEGTQGMFGVPPAYTGWKLVFTGHSLGGALAILAATMAESQGWQRLPDAVVTFGAPRVADHNLSMWWESHSLCEKLLRVSVYNDAVHWMPFDGLSVLDNVFDCIKIPGSCRDTSPLHIASRWANVCPQSEFIIPGAMKGINSELKDFSALGGILSHFLNNGLFGYGYGVVNGPLVLMDDYCGVTPAVFPRFDCTVIEDLTGSQCVGLSHDPHAIGPDDCQSNCCQDLYCEVWQYFTDGRCWRGRSETCSKDHKWAKDVIASQRVH